MQFRFLFTFLALLMCVSLSAQNPAERATNRAKNRAENRANSRVDQKIDQAVDDAFNSIFKKKAKPAAETNNGAQASTDSTQASADQATANVLGSIMGGNSGPWEPYTNPYTFSLTMSMKEVKKNGKEENTTMDMAVTTNRFGIRAKDSESKEVSRMILNTEDGKTTMVTIDKDGKKSGIRMQMPGMRAAFEDAAEDIDSDRFTFSKTGERKVIDGYNCEKYIVKDTKEGTTTETWVTQDLGMNAQDLFGSMMGMFGASKQRQTGPANALAGGFTGFPILSTSDDGKSTYETRFTNIKFGEAKADRSILDTTGVTIQDLGF